MEVIQPILQSISSINHGIRARYDYGSRVQLVLCAALLCAAYLHTVVRRLAPGFNSLIATIPIIIGNIWLPMLFSSRTELVTRVVMGLLLFWLGNFKAVGLCLNRGPLSGNNWNLLQVCLLYIGPMYPRQDGPVKKGRLTDSAGSNSKLFKLAVAHAVALSLLAYALAELPLPMVLKHYVYGLALCSFISFLMNGPAAVLITLAELEVVPPFDKPWMATSLADFWSRRWNNTVSLTLRSLIYDPIVEGTWIHKGPAAAAAAAEEAPARAEDNTSASKPTAAPAAAADGSKECKPPRVHPLKRLAGTAATFVVSGIMHEFILLYALHEGNTYPAGFWFMFFFCQVPLLVFEDVARRRLRKAGIRLARPVAMGWTTTMILFTAYFFWYPPVERYTDVALRVVTSVNEGAATAVHLVQLLLQQIGLQQAAGSAALFGSVSQAAL